MKQIHFIPGAQTFEGIEGGCPYCDRPNNLATSYTKTNQAPPKPGNVSFCFGCGEFAIFEAAGGGKLRARKPRPEETAKIEARPETQKLLAFWRSIQARLA